MARVRAVAPAARPDAASIPKAMRPPTRDDPLTGLLQRCVSGRCGCARTPTTDEKQRADVPATQSPLSTRSPVDGDPLGGLLQRAVAVRASGPMLARLTERDCAPRDGGKPDKAAHSDPTKWTLTIAVDRESEGVWGRLVDADVGHTWIKLSHNGGELWSFGMWPQTGFNPLMPASPVKGCIHHPDRAHEPPRAVEYKEIAYDISEKQYEDALAFAKEECLLRPDYNLMSYNCTTFAVETARKARVKPPPSSSLSVDNPNAIFEGIEEELDKEPDSVRPRAAAYAAKEIELPADVRPRARARAWM